MPDRITIKIEREDGTTEAYSTSDPKLEINYVDPGLLLFHSPDLTDGGFMIEARRIAPQESCKHPDMRVVKTNRDGAKQLACPDCLSYFYEYMGKRTLLN